MTGQLVTSPPHGDHRQDWDSALEQLHHVCEQLNVGRHGYLSQRELGQVCQFIGMEQMNEEVRLSSVSDLLSFHFQFLLDLAS